MKYYEEQQDSKYILTDQRKTEKISKEDNNIPERLSCLTPEFEIKKTDEQTSLRVRNELLQLQEIIINKITHQLLPAETALQLKEDLHKVHFSFACKRSIAYDMSSVGGPQRPTKQ